MCVAHIVGNDWIQGKITLILDNEGDTFARQVMADWPMLMGIASESSTLSLRLKVKQQQT